jgi:hypothetical protein
LSERRYVVNDVSVAAFAGFGIVLAMCTTAICFALQNIAKALVLVAEALR